MAEINMLQEKLEEIFAQDPHLRDYPIEVVNRNGVVTLTGEVPSEEHSRMAEAAARQTDGVVTVFNELVVDADIDHSSNIRPGTPFMPRR